MLKKTSISQGAHMSTTKSLSETQQSGVEIPPTPQIGNVLEKKQMFESKKSAQQEANQTKRLSNNLKPDTNKVVNFIPNQEELSKRIKNLKPVTKVSESTVEPKGQDKGRH